MIHPPRPPKVLGLQVLSLFSALNNIKLSTGALQGLPMLPNLECKETESHCVVQAGLKLLGSKRPPTPKCWDY
ncbi:hypothetical protein AAY473_031090, partial [Plecturocebus cupreus]